MQRPGFSLCICPDSRLLRDHIEAALGACPPAGGGERQRQVFWGDESLPDAFWNTLTLPNLFGGGTALVLRLANLLPAETWKQLSARLARPNESTWLFLCLEVEFEYGEPKIPAHINKLACLRFARERGWVWLSPGLDARSMRDFVRRRAATLNLKFARGVEAALLDALPNDASGVDAGLEQLSLYAGQAEVSLDMVEIARREIAMDIFSLVRAFHGKSQGVQGAAVWRNIAQERLSGDGFIFNLLGVLQREARQMWQLLFGEEVRLPSSVIGQKRDLARALGPAGLGRLWEAVVQAEFGIKSGERSPDQALDLLTADLFTVFGGLGSRKN